MRDSFYSLISTFIDARRTFIPTVILYLSRVLFKVYSFVILETRVSLLEYILFEFDFHGCLVSFQFLVA